MLVTPPMYNRWDDSLIYVTYMWYDSSVHHMRHDVSVCVTRTWLLHIHWHDKTHHSMCDRTISRVWHDSSVSRVWHDSSTCTGMTKLIIHVTCQWLFRVCDMLVNPPRHCHDKTQRICDMTPPHTLAWQDSSYIWHDSFMVVTWLLHLH